MRIPEWEMEEIIVSNPMLLEPVRDNNTISRLEQQFYLPDCGGYIDILISMLHGLLIVELKNEWVHDVDVINSQIAKYEQELNKLNKYHSFIKCLLVSTEGFSNEVIKAANSKSIILQVISVKDLLRASYSRAKNSYDESISANLRILQRRHQLKSLKSAERIFDNPNEAISKKDIESVKKFGRDGGHDECGIEGLASTFRKISKNAPIMAHLVAQEENGVDKETDYRLQNEEDKWFWFFYSVLDRRANASTFVKAKKALQVENIFNPENLVQLHEISGYDATINQIHNILKAANFPISPDSTRHHLAMPSSIIDAALYLMKFDFSVDNILNHFKVTGEKDNKIPIVIMHSLKNKMYGVGDRIASQIVRGLTLKGGWNLKLSHPVFLEYCNYNNEMAGPSRLNLIKIHESYEKKLSGFADQYLSKDYGIISHVLWFVRKRYCPSAPSKLSLFSNLKCHECPFAGFCVFFRRKVLQKTEERFGPEQLSLFDSM